MELKKLGWVLFFKKYFSGGHLQVMNSSPQPQMIQMINQPANGITYQGQEQAIIQESGQPIYIETQAQNQQVLKPSRHPKLVIKHEKCVFHTLMHILIE